jgi:3-oxoacyl-[acyl-carrier protein] reductase
MTADNGAEDLMAVSSTPEPRVAIVTGGSRGIGRSVVQRLAADGFAVAVGYASNRAEADAAVAEAQAAGTQAGGGRAIAVSADVGDEHTVAALFDQVEETFGGIDVVVNAAGLMSLAPLADFDLAVLDRMLRTNIRGTFVVDQQAARRVRPGGAIINFSSSVLGRVLPTYTGYAASKAAVEAMTFILAHELRGRDVTVNAVAPGPTATDMFLEGKDQALLDRLASAVPLERLGVPADIAPMVAFLASPEGHWVNGQTIRVNGGII